MQYNGHSTAKTIITKKNYITLNIGRPLCLSHNQYIKKTREKNYNPFIRQLIGNDVAVVRKQLKKKKNVVLI